MEVKDIPSNLDIWSRTRRLETVLERIAIALESLVDETSGTAKARKEKGDV